MLQISAESFESEVIECEGVVLVEFTADWCGVCKRSEKLFSDAEKELTDVKFCFVDIDRDKELADKFSVRGVPTIVVFCSGEVKSRKTGALTKADLYSMLGRKPAGI